METTTLHTPAPSVEVPRMVRPVTAMEQKWLGAKVSVLIRACIDCHIPATITQVDELGGRVYCEITIGSGWDKHSGWRLIGEHVPRGIYGDTQPTITVSSWPNDKDQATDGAHDENQPTKSK